MRGLPDLAGALVLTLLSGPAWSAGNPERGRQLADRWCASCHLVGPEQREASADVPSFASVARRDDLSEALLAAFLTNPHPPMPNMSLTRQEIADVLAYIRGLR
ncbi:c-type cytochrome [Microvirga yunnanensis]|uniref:c-type cytochrome n=1 Tax=Microvirga yunnanensis TaxID=2953740 RepID=UPI0021C7E289|nr:MULTISPECIES: cytochrome c [unclassified Microvirga]